MYYEIRADVIISSYYSVYYYWCINVHELCSNPMSFLWKFMYGVYLGILVFFISLLRQLPKMYEAQIIRKEDGVVLTISYRHCIFQDPQVSDIKLVNNACVFLSSPYHIISSGWLNYNAPGTGPPSKNKI